MPQPVVIRLRSQLLLPPSGEAAQTSATVKLGTDGLPVEFRIWAYGDVNTEKGKFKLTKESCAEVMKRASTWGNDFPIDWSHTMLDSAAVDPAESGKAAGWFRPQVRDDGLWAVGCSWTPTAKQKLTDREFRYFSPAFSIDKANAIVGLTNIALTNLPATREMEPLVADNRGGPMDPELKKFLDALQAGFEARLTALTTAIEAVKTSIKPAAEIKPKCDKCGGIVAVMASVSPEALDKIDDETPEAKRGFKAELVKLSGKATTSEAVGIVLGWKEQAGKVEGLEAELVKLRSAGADSEVEKVLAAAEAEGKITPAMRPRLLEMGKKDLKILSGFLSVAPKVKPPNGEKTETAPGGKKPAKSDAEIEADLTDDDRYAAKLLGMDSPEQLVALAKRKAELGDIPRLQ